MTYAAGVATLRDATEPLGLWPECAPDEPAGDERLLRRPLRAARGAERLSMTATVRDGLFVQVTAFDEPPEWEDGPAGPSRRP